MTKTSVQRVTKTLRIMISITIICNIIALLFVPAFVCFWPDGVFAALEERILHLLNIKPYGEDDIYIPIIMLVLACWGEIWENTMWVLYSLFLFVCGSCTLVMLCQARNILDTILKGNPFQMVNAVSMKKAAICCWIISGAAVVRLVVELAWLRSTAPLYMYNTLFIPIFFMGGLLFMVMSALFRQAAELQEDQDLTI